MKRLIAGILLVILLVGTVSCGKSTGLVPPTTAVTRPVPTTIVPAPQGGKVVPAPVITLADQGGASAPRTTQPPPVTLAPPVANEGSFSGYQASVTDRMIIRNGNMQLVVTDVATAMKQITALASTYGGFVVNSNVQESQGRLFGNISIRVRSEGFNDALAALRAMAVDVRSESTSGQDVTEEYTDLTSNLRNLQAAESQLLKLLEQAGKVTEILEVQKELVKTRGEIEQIKGRMQYLEQSSSLAFIQINLEQSSLAVEFTATARSVKEGEKIRFDPSISGGFAPYSFEWTFGDGQTSTDDRPVHAYRNDGTYTVSLKVTDDRGSTANLTRDKYIAVLAGWSAGNTAGSAWNGLIGLGHFLVDVLIWVVYLSPVWIVILAVALYFGWWRPRKKAKK